MTTTATCTCPRFSSPPSPPGCSFRRRLPVPGLERFKDAAPRPRSTPMSGRRSKRPRRTREDRSRGCAAPRIPASCTICWAAAGSRGALRRGEAPSRGMTEFCVRLGRQSWQGERSRPGAHRVQHLDRNRAGDGVNTVPRGGWSPAWTWVGRGVAGPPWPTWRPWSGGAAWRIELVRRAARRFRGAGDAAARSGTRKWAARRQRATCALLVSGKRCSRWTGRQDRRGRKVLAAIRLADIVIDRAHQGRGHGGRVRARPWLREIDPPGECAFHVAPSAGQSPMRVSAGGDLEVLVPLQPGATSRLATWQGAPGREVSPAAGWIPRLAPIPCCAARVPASSTHGLFESEMTEARGSNVERLNAGGR